MVSYFLESEKYLWRRKNWIPIYLKQFWKVGKWVPPLGEFIVDEDIHLQVKLSVLEGVFHLLWRNGVKQWLQ